MGGLESQEKGRENERKLSSKKRERGKRVEKRKRV